MKGKSMGSLNYPGYFRNEKYPLSFFLDYPERFVELPWLNLLCYLPLREAQQDQPASIGPYFVLRSIYDNQKGLFQYVKVQLKKLFPSSFLFQELEEPLQYCNDCADILTLERLSILSHQMIVLGFLDHFEEEMILAESIRVIWRQTQKPTQHMTIHAFDYENALWPKDYCKLTWFIPFSEEYPEDSDNCIKRYLSVY